MVKYEQIKVFPVFVMGNKRVTRQEKIAAIKNLWYQTHLENDALKDDFNRLFSAIDEEQTDANVMLPLIKKMSRKDHDLGVNVVSLLSKKLLSNKDFMLAVADHYRHDTNIYKQASQALWGNALFVAKVVSRTGIALQYASHRLRDNESVVSLAVKRCSKAFCFASERLRGKASVMELVINCGYVGETVVIKHGLGENRIRVLKKYGVKPAILERLKKEEREVKDEKTVLENKPSLKVQPIVTLASRVITTANIPQAHSYFTLDFNDVKNLLFCIESLNGHREVIPAQLVSASHLDLYVSQGGCIETIRDNSDSPLTWAVKHNHLEFARLLLSKGAVIQTANLLGYSAVMTCVMFGHVDMLKLLLGYHPDMSPEKNDKQSLLCIATELNHVDIVTVLLAYGVSPNELHTEAFLEEEATCALSMAIKKDNADIFQVLLENGANIQSPPGHNEPLLNYLLLNNKLTLASVLLRFKPELIAEKNTAFYTPLSVAVMHENLEAVKLLCGFNKTLIGINANRSAMTLAIKGTSDTHRKIVSCLVKYSPPPLLWVQRIPGYKTHPELTRILVDRELTEGDIEGIPPQVKTIVYTNKVSIECLQAIEHKGIKVIGPELKMFVDEKYLGGHVPVFKHALNRFAQSLKPVASIYDQGSNVVVELPRLKTFKTAKGKKQALLDALPNKPLEYEFIQARCKPSMSKDAKVFTVFGYRLENACLPIVSDNDCRCLIVLTAEEYNRLSLTKNSGLVKHYDFLILYPRNKVESNEAVKTFMLIERRRLSAEFGRSIGLNYMVFLDDNISEVAVMGQASEKKPTEHLFDYLKQRMEQTLEPMLSIATKSRLNRTVKEKQLGCKFWIENISKLSEALPEECFKALMPYNETLWGEDYYLQILLNVLFSDESKGIHGYKILPINEVQLKRLNSHKSTNAKAGMRVREYLPNDVLHPSVRESIRVKYPDILKRIDLARFNFNADVRANRERYQKKIARCKTLDVDLFRNQQLSVKQCTLIHEVKAFSGSSSDTPLSLITCRVTHGIYGKGALVILYQDTLFYAETAPLTVYEILETDTNKDNYLALKEAVQAGQFGKESTASQRLLIEALIKPERVEVELKGKFIDDLQAILSGSLNEANQFSVSSRGKNVVLREYQNRAIQWLADHLEYSDYDDFTLNMATGTGKTVLMLIIALAAYSADPVKNVMIVFPNIQLVHQTLTKLLSDFKPLLDYFNVPQEKVYGVCSKTTADLNLNDIVSQSHIANYASLRDSGHLYLFCAASLRGFNKLEGLEDDEIKRRNDFMKNVSMVLFDESHKQKKLEESPWLTLRQEGSLSLKFSATPIKSHEKECPDNEFQYLRESGIEEGYLTALLVDKTLPSNCSNEDIKHCLLYHPHPNEGVLKNHKGIIYVSSIAEAKVLAKCLRESGEFENDFVHVFHSGEQETLDAQSIAEGIRLAHFKTKKAGVAIVVNMLVEGYDDENINYVINNKKTSSAKELHQQVGRTIRLNKQNPDKVGYAILKETHSSVSALEKTCYPSALKDRERQHAQFVGTVQHTIHCCSDVKEKESQEISDFFFSEQDSQLNGLDAPPTNASDDLGKWLAIFLMHQEVSSTPMDIAEEEYDETGNFLKRKSEGDLQNDTADFKKAKKGGGDTQPTFWESQASSSSNALCPLYREIERDSSSDESKNDKQLGA